MTEAAAVTVRDYRPADLEPVIALVRELQGHEAALYDRMKPAAAMGAWYIEHLEREVAGHVGRLLVAELDGEVVGYATVLVRVEEDAVDETSHSYANIGDLAVAARLRGRGIGRALIAACEAEARKGGARHLRITVLAANAAARRLYHACGFSDLFVNLEKPLDSGVSGSCD